MWIFTACPSDGDGSLELEDSCWERRRSHQEGEAMKRTVKVKVLVLVEPKWELAEAYGTDGGVLLIRSHFAD